MLALDVQLIPASFPNVDPSDDMFDDVGLILCNVPCSLTSILHPIDYILQEGGMHKYMYILYILPVNVLHVYLIEMYMCSMNN